MVVGVVVFQFLVAVYGGYFGAGIGILMLSALGLMGVGHIHNMNALKTVLAACINIVAVVIFIAEQVVEWRYTFGMAAAAIVGGYVGARVARRFEGNVIRWVVILIGFGLAAHFFYKQFKPSEANATRIEPSQTYPREFTAPSMASAICSREFGDVQKGGIA
jgi:uncharacterized membrane protein YfcA